MLKIKNERLKRREARQEKRKYGQNVKELALMCVGQKENEKGQHEVVAWKRAPTAAVFGRNR